MLLSRVAEHVYWAARYLERTEVTARIVREHTHLIVDLPTSVALTWEPLLQITGSRAAFDGRFERADERSVVHWLVDHLDNPGGILPSIERARENLRTTREVLPRELWQVVNDLHLHVAAHHTDGVARSTRSRFLDRVISDVLRTWGIVDATMPRDDVFAFLHLGRLIERADMTTRVIDVRAASLLRPAPAGAGAGYDDVQWMSVLRSLSALLAFHRSTLRATEGEPTVRYLLLDRAFPRSVASCLAEVLRVLSWLPTGPASHHRPSEVCIEAEDLVNAIAAQAPDGPELHRAMDRLQTAIADLHDRLATTYFLPEPVAR